MDTALLTSDEFWADRAPIAMGDLPGALPSDPRLLASVFFETSGSSGTPKWVVISKAALLASAEAVNRHLEVGPESRWGLALPIYHVGGFGVVARAFQAGCGLAEFGRRWDAGAFAEWISQSGVTHTSLVPTQVHDLVNAEIRAPQCLRAIVVGGGQLDAATGQAARELGWPVLASYGMTEASSQIATQHLSQLVEIYRPSPIPVLPIWKVTRPNHGLLEISGPALFSGYLRSQRAQESMSFDPNDSNSFVTSDRILIDESGLTPQGRADSLVKIMGELVDPEQVERDLIALSNGQLKAGDFVVLAIPDKRAGHQLLPVFEATVDASIISAILDLYHCQAVGFRRLQPAMVIRKIPRSSMGKVLRKKINHEDFKPLGFF